MAELILIRPRRYYFDLTNGTDLIRDEDGLELANIDAALAFACEAIEELRKETASASSEWWGWRLEISDHSAGRVHSISLAEPDWLSQGHACSAALC
jgi:hypothetical protein